MIRPPFVVDDHGELELFRDAAALEGYLEAIDVENGEYTVYDSEGRRVELTTRAVPTRALFGLLRSTVEVVRIAEVEAEPGHARELVGKLRSYLGRLDEPVASGEVAVSELVEQLRRRIGFVA